MLVRIPEPFSFELTTGRYRAFGADPANLWKEGRLYRIFDGHEIAIEAAPGGVEVSPGLDGLEAAVGRYLGASFDLDGFAAFAAEDRVLDGLVRRLRGLRPPLVPDPLETLVTAITAQQVSLRAAFAIRGRLIRRFGIAYEHAHSFPTRRALATATAEDLTSLGFSRRKAEYVIGLARAPLDLDDLAGSPDEEVKRELTALSGIGEWTADWFLARHLARPDAWPAGDLGLRKAVSAFYFAGRPVSTEDVRSFGERFGSHRNLAAHYLLAGLMVPAE